MRTNRSNVIFHWSVIIALVLTSWRHLINHSCFHFNEFAWFSYGILCKRYKQIGTYLHIVQKIQPNQFLNEKNQQKYWIMLIRNWDENLFLAHFHVEMCMFICCFNKFSTQIKCDVCFNKQTNYMSVHTYCQNECRIEMFNGSESLIDWILEVMWLVLSGP